MLNLPLLFVIVFDILLVSLKKKCNPQGKEKREEREKKEREKLKANHRKDWQHITKETNQVSYSFYQQTKGVFI